MTPATLCFVIMSIIKDCQGAEYQRMREIGERGREWDRQQRDGPLPEPAPSLRHTDSTLTTAREIPRTRKNVMFMGDGALRDMFISLHPEDIRAQLS